ncbi:DegT/DnrJ/EryC1/StrS family aminotransferase [Nocardiopsis sp. ARC36]
MPPHRVPRYDYPSQFADIDAELVPDIRELLLSGDYILGDPLRGLEQDLARYLEVPHVVGVNSGTDALVLALDALGVGPGDEVVTVANTFHSTALAVLRVGAHPVLVDCRPDSYLIDLEQAENAITPRTRALLVVHMFGQAVDMEAARGVADRHGLLLVEDCAQAIGARSHGRPVGSTGDAGCWSFAPSKNLAAAGDAGALSVRDEQLAHRLRLLRHFGQSSQNHHEAVAYNSRLDSLQALVLAHKLPRLDDWNSRRVDIATEYRKGLVDLPVSFQEGARPTEHVYHLFQMRTERRDELVAHLQDAGVDAVVRYPFPLHLQKAFQDLGQGPGTLPVAEALARETLCLPLHPTLTSDQIGHVIDTTRRFFTGTP